MCQEWYKELLIEDLLLKNIRINFKEIINDRKWYENPKEFKGRRVFDFDNYTYFFTKPIKLNKEPYKVQLYFAYNKNEVDVLKQDEIEFGISFDSKESFKKIKLSKKKQEKYMPYQDEFIYGTFTLVSHEEYSYIELFQSFINWLKEFPDKNIKKLTKQFIESLITKYQKSLG